MSNPKLIAAFGEQVRIPHLQAAIWKTTMDADPPSLDPVHYRWPLAAASGILVPDSLPPDVPPAQVDVLKLIK
jgi:hypothetical protein